MAPRGIYGEIESLVGKRALIKIGGQRDFGHSWVIREGKVSVGGKLSELLEQMGPGDVYVKGVNALDPQGNAGILVGNALEGGTSGR